MYNGGYGYYYDNSIALYFGLVIGIPFGIVFCCLFTSCTCYCLGYMCNQCWRPGKFDNYHISNEINLHKIMTGTLHGISGTHGIIEETV